MRLEIKLTSDQHLLGQNIHGGTCLHRGGAVLLASCCPLGTVFLEELGTVALFIPRIFTPEVRSVQSQSHFTCSSPSGWKKGNPPLPRQGDACAARACVRGGSVAWILLRGARGAAVPQCQPRSSQVAEAQAELGTFPWWCWDPVQDLSLLPPGDPNPKTADPRAASTTCISSFPTTCVQTPSPSRPAEGSSRVFSLSSPFSPSHLVICFA